MKKIIFLFSIAFIYTCQLGAQTPSWSWAERPGCTLVNEGNAVTTDAAGYIYATGYFTSPIITFGNITLTNSDSTGSSANVYVVKYTPQGNAIWARTLNDNGSDYANGITTDSHGNVYVTGEFDSDTIYFGVSTLINYGSGDVFLAKFDSSGNALWAKGAGGTNTDYGSGVATDTSGNVYITGTFISAVIEFDSIKIRNRGGGCCAEDIFIAKYTSAGKLLWAKGDGGSSSDFGKAIATDIEGNAYITGQFASPYIVIGNDTLTNSVSSVGAKLLTSDIFIAKYNPAGNVVWAHDAGGIANDYACGITTFNNDVYITGAFASDSITFDTIHMIKSFTGGSCNIFITKYDSSGNAIWARQPQCMKITGDNIGYGINASTGGKINITGIFSDSTVSFGSSTLINAGYADIFVTQYDTSGNPEWALSAGSNNNDYSNCITTDPNGYIYITGYFEDSILVFGNLPALFDTGGTYNPPSIFIAKLNPGITVGINEKTVQNPTIVTVYPNPANSVFAVGIPASSTDIKIYNSLGQIVTQTKVTEETKEYFSLSESGIYFVSVTTAKGIITKKVVVY